MCTICEIQGEIYYNKHWICKIKKIKQKSFSAQWLHIHFIYILEMRTNESLKILIEICKKCHLWCLLGGECSESWRFAADLLPVADASVGGAVGQQGAAWSC